MATLSKGSKGNKVRMLQKGLNMELKLSLVVDGDYGNGTVTAVKALQTRSKLPVTGIYAELEEKLIGPMINEKFLSFDTVTATAKAEGLHEDVLKAIADVESKGSGFLNDGRPIILFERHKFYEHLAAKKGVAAAKAAQAANPNICHPVWDKTTYRGKEGEYTRLAQAKQFDEDCALMAASWGMFQILGSNHVACGYSSVKSFVDDAYKNETIQFKGLISFIKANRRIKDAVMARDFDSLARYYNGPAYSVQGYHTKLRNAASYYLKNPE